MQPAPNPPPSRDGSSEGPSDVRNAWEEELKKLNREDEEAAHAEEREYQREIAAIDEGLAARTKSLETTLRDSLNRFMADFILTARKEYESVAQELGVQLRDKVNLKYGQRQNARTAEMHRKRNELYDRRPPSLTQRVHGRRFAEREEASPISPPDATAPTEHKTAKRKRDSLPCPDNAKKSRPSGEELESNGPGDSAEPQSPTEVQEPTLQDPGPALETNSTARDMDRSPRTEPLPVDDVDSKPAEPHTRTITFEEVYCNGNPKYHHWIVQYPAGSGNWYILKCDEHGIHFKPGDTACIHGAAKHLAGRDHGQPREHRNAIFNLGFLIPGCTAEMAEVNNAKFIEATRRGYMPLNLKQRPAKPNSSRGAKAHKNKRQQTSKEYQGINNPIPGELYLGFWTKDRRLYPIVILTWNGVRSTRLLGTEPSCYIVDRKSQQIVRWAKGYEDGGKYVNSRYFPVVFHDGQKQVGWLRVKHIHPFDFESPDRAQIPMFDYARDEYAKLRGFADYQDMKAKRGVPEIALCAPLENSTVTDDADDGSSRILRFESNLTNANSRSIATPEHAAILGLHINRTDHEEEEDSEDQDLGYSDEEMADSNSSGHRRRSRASAIDSEYSDGSEMDVDSDIDADGSAGASGSQARVESLQDGNDTSTVFVAPLVSRPAPTVERSAHPDAPHDPQETSLDSSSVLQSSTSVAQSSNPHESGVPLYVQPSGAQASEETASDSAAKTRALEPPGPASTAQESAQESINQPQILGSVTASASTAATSTSDETNATAQTNEGPSGNSADASARAGPAPPKDLPVKSQGTPRQKRSELHRGEIWATRPANRPITAKMTSTARTSGTPSPVPHTRDKPPQRSTDAYGRDPQGVFQNNISASSSPAVEPSTAAITTARTAALDTTNNAGAADICDNPRENFVSGTAQTASSPSLGGERSFRDGNLGHISNPTAAGSVVGPEVGARTTNSPQERGPDRTATPGPANGERQFGRSQNGATPVDGGHSPPVNQAQQIWDPVRPVLPGSRTLEKEPTARPPEAFHLRPPHPHVSVPVSHAAGAGARRSSLGPSVASMMNPSPPAQPVLRSNGDPMPVSQSERTLSEDTRHETREPVDENIPSPNTTQPAPPRGDGSFTSPRNLTTAPFGQESGMGHLTAALADLREQAQLRSSVGAVGSGINFEAGRRNSADPLVNPTRPPKQDQVFDVAAYAEVALGGCRHAPKLEGRYPRLVVDGNTARTLDNLIDIKVDPRHITKLFTTVISESSARVDVLRDDGSSMQLTFAKRPEDGRSIVGKVQARRFCAWVIHVNPEVALGAQ